MSFDDRVAICEAALEDEYSGDIPTGVNINPIEEYLDKPNYTYLTLRVLTKQFGEKPAIAMGVDVINSLPKWKNYEEIITYPIVVLTRPGYELDKSITSNLNIIEIISKHTDISSSMIRKGMGGGDSGVGVYMTETSFAIYNRIYNIDKVLKNE
jgi:nicotinic acid mononucleotide adenylyltransferase